MSQPPVIRRVEIVEGNAEALGFLPARIDALTIQIVQFREEVRDEVSATRSDLRADVQALRAEAAAYIDLLSTRVDSLSAHVDSLSARFDAAHIETLRDELHHELRNGDEEIRRCMRVLHELVMARISAIRESRSQKR